MDLIKITTTNKLNDIKDPVDGQVAYIEKDNGNEYFLYQNKAWFPVQGEMTSSGLQLNLYELNRNIISQLPDFEDSQWEGAESVFKEWLEGKTCKYFMLYGREINYFTIFKKKTLLDEKTDFETLFKAVKECLTALGPVKSVAINKLEDGSASSIEIWVKYEDVVTCMYLFDYEEGIVVYEQ